MKSITQFTPERGDLQGNWDKLMSLTDQVISEDDPTGDDTQLHLALLDSIKRDVELENKLLAGHFRAPAAKGNHHAFEGGLNFHLLEMWQCYMAQRDYWGDAVLFESNITDARVLKAILYHDIHKAFRTFEIVDADEWHCVYCNDYTDKLMGSDVKSLWIINSVGIQLDPEQINALLNAEGGYAKIKTDWQSSLSKLCYTLDEMSGNVLGRIHSRTVLNLREPEPVK